MSGADFDAEFARLKAGYRQRLAAVAQRLSAAAASSDLREVMHIAHRLKGSAGSYGFHELGEAAARVEAEVAGQPGHGLPQAMTRLLECIATTAAAR